MLQSFLELILVVGSSVAPCYDAVLDACIAASAHPYRAARISAASCLRSLSIVVHSKASELAHKVLEGYKMAIGKKILSFFPFFVAIFSHLPEPIVYLQLLERIHQYRAAPYALHGSCLGVAAVMGGRLTFYFLAVLFFTRIQRIWSPWAAS
jgi:hypothetical protein